MKTSAAPLLATLALVLGACQQADSSQAVPGEKLYFGNAGVRDELAAGAWRPRASRTE